MFSHKSAVIIYRLSFLQLDKESSEIFQRLDHCFPTLSVRSWLHFGSATFYKSQGLLQSFFFLLKEIFFKEKFF